MLDLPFDHVPSPQQGQGGYDEALAFGAGGGEWVEFELAPFRVFAMGVQPAEQCSAGQVAGDGEVVAGGEDGGSDRRFDVFAHSEHADVELLLRERLAEEDALELVFAVVD